MEILRKLQEEERINWVDALPRTLRMLHDRKGITGLSPYEILFGRERPLGNKPYEPTTECQDAKDFFNKMAEIDTMVARVLNNKHKKITEDTNRHHKEKDAYKPGTWVWYKRPEDSGTKLDTRWIGPALVLSRNAENSYTVELRPGVTIAAPRIFLKECIEDTYSGRPQKLYYHQRTPKIQFRLPHESEVIQILDHRLDDEDQFQFLTQWEDQTPEEATWEALKKFVPLLHSKFVEYVNTHDLDIPLL
jgi:hypothetical protein